jgi:AraC-like DNA-binding protein
MAKPAQNMKKPATPGRSVMGHTWSPPHRLRPALVTVIYSHATQLRRRRHVHRRWVLDYNFDPMQGVQVGAGRGSGQWLPREAPTAHLYAPQTAYLEVPSSPPRAMRSAYMLFEHGEAAALEELLDPQGAAQFLDPGGQIGRLLEEAAQAGRCGDAGRYRAHSHLLAIVDLLHRASRTAPGRYVVEVDARPQTFVDRVEEVLAQRIRQRVRLRDVARAMSVSESSLSHRYRQDAGRSPMARLLEMRVNLAQGLLLRGVPLKTAAAQTGFADAFHLSRSFKRIVGVAPRVWLGR